MTARRFPDWQLRLRTFVRGRAREPFAWGRNDCALFAADAVQALTGVLHCADLRGHACARAALRAQRAAGGLLAIATRALGASVGPQFATVGDVVCVRMGKRLALAICNGGVALCPGARGLEPVPMAHAVAAWRVG